MPFLAFFPPGVSPFSLQHQLYLPELSPNSPARKLGGFLSAFYLPVPPSCVCSSRNLAPIPICCFFSYRIPGSLLQGWQGGRGGGAALVFLLPGVMIVTSGRVVLQPFHTTKLRAEVSCAGVSSGTLPGAFFQLSADSSRAGGTGVTCLFCICGVHIRGDSIYRYKHFILKCREFRCELLPCSRSPVYYSQKVLYWDKRFRKKVLSAIFTSRGYKGGISLKVVCKILRRLGTDGSNAVQQPPKH